MQILKILAILTLVLLLKSVTAQVLPLGLRDSVRKNPFWVIDTLLPMLEASRQPALDSPVFYSCLSGSYLMTGEMGKSKTIIKMGLSKFPEDAAVLNQAGSLYATIGILDTAVIYQRAGAEKYLEIGDSSRYYMTSFNLAASYMRVDKTKLGLQKTIEVLNYFKRIEDTPLTTIALAALGNYYAQMGKMKDARKNMLEALKNIDSIAPHQAAALYQNLGVNFEETGEYEAADQYYVKAIETAALTSNDRMRISATTNQAVLMVTSGRYEEARQAFKALSEDSAMEYFPDRKLEVYYSWFKADSALIDFPEAFRHVKNYHNIYKQYEDERIKKSVADTETKYFVKEQIAEKAILTEKVKAQEVIDRYQKLGLLCLSAIGLILFAGFWFVRRESQIRATLNNFLNERNKEITKQSDQIRTLHTELHHRTKNNFNSIIFLLKNHKKRAEAEGLDVSVANALQRQIKAYTKLQEHIRQDQVTVELKAYLEDFCEHLREIFTNSGQPVHFNHNLAEVEVKSDFAATLALIVNELATNSVKYAHREDGALSIALDTVLEPHEELRIFYRDGGPADGEIDPATYSSGQGSSLIEDFTEQLEGAIVRYGGKDGYDFEAVFALTA